MADEASTTDGGTTDGAQNAAQDAQAPAQEANTPPTPQAPTEPSNGPEKGTQSVEDLPDWAQTLIRKTRDEAAQNRTARNTEREQADARVAAILKAAGIETDDDTEDPVKAAEADRQAREKAEQDARTARVELAVYRAAPAANGDAAALLDSRSFLDRITDLDPSDQDAITGAIRDAIKDAPRLAATQAAARSGADFTGGTGDGAITPQKFRDMDMQQRNELFLSDPDTYRRLAASK
ncbi:hypothetical protein [Brachybacterium sp. NPDC056505]|uniref:hypothetical protein n=1 Tax=Brachybacterium sp. NPDC056505 TaxID=3345843 RepID=UPI003672E2B1